MKNSYIMQSKMNERVELKRMKPTKSHKSLSFYWIKNSITSYKWYISQQLIFTRENFLEIKYLLVINFH